MIHQELQQVPELSVAQNIYLGAALRRAGGLIVDSAAQNAEARRILAPLDPSIDVTAPIRSLRVAQRQIVEIANQFFGRHVLARHFGLGQGLANLGLASTLGSQQLQCAALHRAQLADIAQRERKAEDGVRFALSEGAALLIAQFVTMWGAFFILAPSIDWPASLDQPPAAILPLIAALTLVDKGVLSSSSTGAMHGEVGQTQFLPKNVLLFGSSLNGGGIDLNAAAKIFEGMVEKFKDKPFAFISVSADDEKKPAAELVT